MAEQIVESPAFLDPRPERSRIGRIGQDVLKQGQLVLESLYRVRAFHVEDVETGLCQETAQSLVGRRHTGRRVTRSRRDLRNGTART